MEASVFQNSLTLNQTKRATRCWQRWKPLKPQHSSLLRSSTEETWAQLVDRHILQLWWTSMPSLLLEALTKINWLIQLLFQRTIWSGAMTTKVDTGNESKLRTKALGLQTLLKALEVTLSLGIWCIIQHLSSTLRTLESYGTTQRQLMAESALKGIQWSAHSTARSAFGRTWR